MTGTGNQAVTHTDSEKGIHLKIKFRIEKFESLMSYCEEGLWSGDVSSEKVPRAIWKLKVYPKSRRCNNASVYLFLTGPMVGLTTVYGERDCKEILKATYHLYLIDGADGTTDSIHRGNHKFGGDGYDYSRPKQQDAMVSYDRVRKALQADRSLMVAADIAFLAPDDGSNAKAIDESVIHGYEVQQRWGVKFSKLYGDQASSDCSIQIGGVSIQAHKSILIPHSPIFRRMFTNPLAEEYQSSTLKITDFKEPEPMRALVRYCYQGFLDTETMDGNGAMEIFKLTDRYCVTGLKALLEQHFINKTLNMGNAVALAVLADMHSAPKLKEACIELIASEEDSVFEIAGWREHSDKELIAEVFQLAEKYSLPELKTQLQKHFIDKRLRVENVVSLAILADMHSAEKLMEACTKLIAEEGKAVYKSPEWKELREANPKFAIDLSEGVATVLAERLAQSELAADLVKKEAAELKLGYVPWEY